MRDEVFITDFDDHLQNYREYFQSPPPILNPALPASLYNQSFDSLISRVAWASWIERIARRFYMLKDIFGHKVHPIDGSIVISDVARTRISIPLGQEVISSRKKVISQPV